MTLAIETSCDDTSVAILEKHDSEALTPDATEAATLHFHEKITSDNRATRGIDPVVALVSHQANLAGLIAKALRSLPLRKRSDSSPVIQDVGEDRDGRSRKKPDFVTVTRGPGMRSNLAVGLDTAKGLALAWQVPLLAVNHMQAHALTPRLIDALESDIKDSGKPAFPFLTLLVSGGHTMLVHSRSLCEHSILAETTDMAIGDLIDKCARHLLPDNILGGSKDVMYGRLLEEFVFPRSAEEHLDYNYTAPASRLEEMEMRDVGYGWSIRPPMWQYGRNNQTSYSFSGLESSVLKVLKQRPDIGVDERRALGREVMRLAFEHLATRVVAALTLHPELKDVDTLVVSGGVASNQFLKHVLNVYLQERGIMDMHIIFPPPRFCTDNAAMIAWTGMEMYAAGWESTLDCLPLKKWPVDGKDGVQGILGVGGWQRRRQEH